MTTAQLKKWCKEVEVDPTDADEILWTVDEMDGMFGDEDGKYAEIREYVYNNMLNESKLEEKDDSISRDSYIEKCIQDAIKTCSNEYTLDNIAVRITDNGNLHIMTRDGKDICTIGGERFDEEDIDILRQNDYLVKPYEELIEIDENKQLTEVFNGITIQCPHCNSKNVTFGNKMFKLEEDNKTAYTFFECWDCHKFAKAFYSLSEIKPLKPIGESKKIMESKGMMDLIDSMQNWASASSDEYSKTKNKEYLDLAGLIEKVIDKSKSIIEEKNEDKVQESKKLTESISTYDELKEQIEAAYHTVFPNSICEVSKGALGKDTFFITFYLAGNKSEFNNGIPQNDIFTISFFVKPDSRDVELDIDAKLPDTLTMEVNDNSITTTPTNQYMAYGSERVPLRKVSGTPEKIVQTITKYAEKTKEVLNKLVAEDRIPKDHIELVKSKLNENKMVENNKLEESKSISLYGKSGTPFALSNEIDNVPLFEDEIEDNDRSEYMNIIKKYSSVNNLEVHDETQSSIVFKFNDVFDNLHFLRITDNLGSEEQGKSKRVTCTNKSGTPLSISYAGITEQQDFKKAINKASKEQYVEVTQKYSYYDISLVKQNDTKTILSCKDDSNIVYLNIYE